MEPHGTIAFWEGEKLTLYNASQIINGAHLATAGDLAVLVDEATAGVGVVAQLYLIDMGQQWLRPVRAARLPA